MDDERPPTPTIEYARPGLRVPREWRNLDLVVVGAVVVIFCLWRFAPVERTDRNGKVDSARNDVQNLSHAIAQYESDTGRYPTAEEGLHALVVAPPTAATWRGPYLGRRGVPNDPWGGPYVYHPEAVTGGRGYQVLSAGRDGLEGTADDVKEAFPATDR